MSRTDVINNPPLHTISDTPTEDSIQQSFSGKNELKVLPMVSIITPAYNEEAILESNLTVLCEYMKKLEDRYTWEIVVVNDGSKDKTAELADAFSLKNPQVQVIHHRVNRNLGGALRTGFRHAKGDYVIVLDLDLSYSEDHIEALLIEIEETEADIVIASPYMKGGKCTKVPTNRLVLSKVVNRFMRFTAKGNIHTFTGMVRAYRASFLKHLNLKSNTYSVNPEIIQKALILRARIVEIPAHLDWSLQQDVGLSRSSSIKIFKGILAGLMSGFIFRPYAFFMVVGLILFGVSSYMIGWIFINLMSVLPEIQATGSFFDDQLSMAIAALFKARPHAFLIGGTTLIVALQFLGIGFLSLQNKRYFDELFHLNTNIKKNVAGYSDE